MKLKINFTELVASLFLSPVIFYITIGLAKICGASYHFSNGEAFIIWLLLAILIKLSFIKK
jgi:hypothetical protein